MRIKPIIPVLVGAAVLAVPSIASADVTYNPATGVGFVGKGNVQTAFGWNNAALQKNAEAVMFKYSQPAEQTITEDAKQVGTQSAEQTVRRHVSCVVVTGNDRNPVEHDRFGARDGERTGERSGSHTGSRSGTVNGTVASAINGDPRQVKGQQQFTGFNLTGKSEATFTASGEIKWGDDEFGATQYGADPIMSGIEWGGWGQNSDPTDNPASCLSGNSNVEDLVDTTTESPITYGDMKFGDTTYSNRQYNTPVTTGAGSMLAGITPTDFRVIWPVSVA